jgi:hypothetical protein
LEKPYKNLAVKVTKLRNDTDIVNDAKREYNLAKWAATHEIGPPVYCEAILPTRRGKRHLLFMENLWGSLGNLINESRFLPSKFKNYQLRFAWMLAFIQLEKVSKYMFIGADLKPQNFLVKFAGTRVLGVYITDWDNDFWIPEDSADDSLFYNFFCILVNTMFIIKNKADLDVHWGPDICNFVSHLIKWSTTPAFLDFLIKNDKINSQGPYHYAENFPPERWGKKSQIDRAKRFLESFNIGIKNRWGDRMEAFSKKATGSILAVTDIGNKKFTVKLPHPRVKPS